MGQRTDVFDLGRLGLSSGEGRRLEPRVPVTPFDMAGQQYTAVGSPVPVVLDVSKMTSGYSLRLRFEVPLSGPCMRCLDDAGAPVDVDTREIDQPGGGEDLDSPYVDGDDLRLGDWTRDALVLALPAQVLCSPECRGLCPTCGENLNHASAEHGHERQSDPRWAALSALRVESE